MVTYTPIIKDIEVNSSIDLDAIDSVHTSQFRLDSEAIDESRWFDKIQSLRLQNEKLRTERHNSISIEKQGGWFWFLIVLTIMLILTTGGLITYNILLSRESSHRHRRMANDIMELKSNYCEVKIDCPTCPTKTHAKPAGFVQNEAGHQISAGNSASVNINVNTPLPTNRPLPAVEHHASL